MRSSKHEFRVGEHVEYRWGNVWKTNGTVAELASANEPNILVEFKDEADDNGVPSYFFNLSKLRVLEKLCEKKYIGMGEDTEIPTLVDARETRLLKREREQVFHEKTDRKRLKRLQAIERLKRSQASSASSATSSSLHVSSEQIDEEQGEEQGANGNGIGANGNGNGIGYEEQGEQGANGDEEQVGYEEQGGYEEQEQEQGANGVNDGGAYDGGDDGGGCDGYDDGHDDFPDL